MTLLVAEALPEASREVFQPVVPVFRQDHRVVYPMGPVQAPLLAGCRAGFLVHH